MRFRVALVVVASAALIAMNVGGSGIIEAWGGGHSHRILSCGRPSSLCTETSFNRQIWPHKYIGHDEPGLTFLSKHKGSGNHYQANFVLPKDPPPKQIPGRSYNFETFGAFWFGMIVCDSQSYPEQTKKCAPDSDHNITSLQHYPGSAYVEMQFYAPGWVPWPAGYSCDAKQWCAALNIDSLAWDPVNNTSLNDSCSNAIGGSEYVNFAFITKNGKAQGPANPVGATDTTFTPSTNNDLFMNSGDHISLRMHDSSNGLQINVIDHTTHHSGSMTASKANGFAQMKFVPNPSVQCTPIPYDFHPMYSTATSKTVLPWGAIEDNIEFVDEIGHFDWCASRYKAIQPGGNCPQSGYEGPQHNRSVDYDDQYCFPASDSTLVNVSGCQGTNVRGYDGASYLPDWPDGNTSLHPGPFLFSSPTIGKHYKRQYGHAVFDTDLPAIEPALQCRQKSLKTCSHFPLTDEGNLAPFYPFFATVPEKGSCQWELGNDIPRLTKNDFGKNAQYGKLIGYKRLKASGHGATVTKYTGFRNVLPNNPCT